jgi:hypothetical protein
LHLPEVLLASESGQVAEKNEETQVVEMIFQARRVTVRIPQEKTLDVDSFNQDRPASFGALF